MHVGVGVLGASGQSKNYKGNSGSWPGSHPPLSTTAASHPRLRSDFSPPTASLWSPCCFCQGHQRPPSHSFSAHLTPLQSPSLRCFVSLATTSLTFLVSLLFPWLLFLLVCKLPFLSLEFILSLLLLLWAAPRGMQVLVPQPGIKPVPTAVEAQSLNHWNTRKVLPVFSFLLLYFFQLYWDVIDTHVCLRVRYDTWVYILWNDGHNKVS